MMYSIHLSKCTNRNKVNIWFYLFYQNIDFYKMYIFKFSDSGSIQDQTDKQRAGLLFDLATAKELKVITHSVDLFIYSS